MQGLISTSESNDLEFLANSLSQPVFIFRNIRQLDFINQAALKFLGYGRDKEYPSKLMDFLYPADVEIFIRFIEEFEDTVSTPEFDIRLKHKSGNYTWFHCKLKPKVDHVNDLIRWFCIAEILDEENIIKRKLKEEVSKNQYLIKQITDATPDVLYVFDLDSEKSIFTNKHVKDILGYEAEELYSLKTSLLEEIVHPDDLHWYRSSIKSFKDASDDEVKEFQVRVYDKQGRLHWIKERQKIFKRNKDGRPVQVIGISQDITEQKLQEEKIRKQQDLLYIQEQELKRAQEVAKLGSLSFNLRSRQMAASFGLEQILGTSLNNYSYQEYLNFVHKDDLRNFKAELRKAFVKKSIFFIEHRVMTTRDEERWVMTKGKVIGDDDGLPGKIHAIVHDISEKKLVELKLQEQQKFTEHITNTLPDLVYVYDIPSEKNIFFNRSFKEFLGYTDHDTGDDPQFIRNVLHPKDLERMPEDIERVKKCADGEVVEMEYRMMHIDGKYRWLVGRDTVFKRDESGMPEQIVGVVHNITQRKNVEEELTKLNDELEDIVEDRTRELKKNEEQLRLITDALPVLISYVNKNRKFEFVNKAYEDWFDVPVLLIKGMEVEKLLGLLNFQKIDSYINEAFCGKQVSFEIDLDLPYHERKRVSATYIPRWEDGQVQGYFELVNDITYKKMVEENLVKALQESDAKNKELTKINEVLDTFVYAAAHDLKTPVTNLKLFLDLISKTEDHIKRTDYLTAVNASVLRLDNIIRGLVEVIQVQSNLQPSIKNISFDDIFQNVILEQEINLNKFGGTIESDFSGCCHVIYKEAYLLSIIRNLVSNAIKYHSEERPLQIKVRTKKENDYIKLEVEDNGIGIDLDRYGKSLFKPFKRFSKTSEGTGIGLHLIKSIVEKNGGRMEVQSEPGKGALFIAYLVEYEKPL
jgi:PAS domain S-box-containing protein